MIQLIENKQRLYALIAKNRAFFPTAFHRSKTADIGRVVQPCLELELETLIGIPFLSGRLFTGSLFSESPFRGSELQLRHNSPKMSGASAPEENILRHRRKFEHHPQQRAASAKFNPAVQLDSFALR